MLLDDACNAVLPMIWLSKRFQRVRDVQLFVTATGCGLAVGMGTMEGTAASTGQSGPELRNACYEGCGCPEPAHR